MAAAVQPGAGMSLGKPETRAVLLLVLLAVGFVLVYLYQAVFAPLLMAAALAFALEPLVARLEQRGMGRKGAVGLVFGSGMLVMLVGILFLGAQLVHFASAAVDPTGPLVKGVQGLGQLVASMVPDSLQDHIGEQIASITDPEQLPKRMAPALKFLEAILGGIGSFFTFLGVVILMPIYLIYLMFELKVISAWLWDRLPAQGRDRHETVLREIHVGLAGFLRGFLTIALIKGSMLTIGLLIIGTPYAAVVGLCSGLLTVLPFIGGLLGFALALALTLSAEATVMALVSVSVVYALGEILEGFVLMPFVLRGGVRLHPLTILFSVIFWGALFGLFGALAAIPLSVVLKAVLTAYVLPTVDEMAGHPPAVH